MSTQNNISTLMKILSEVDECVSDSHNGMENTPQHTFHFPRAYYSLQRIRHSKVKQITYPGFRPILGITSGKYVAWIPILDPRGRTLIAYNLTVCCCYDGYACPKCCLESKEHVGVKCYLQALQIVKACLFGFIGL